MFTDNFPIRKNTETRQGRQLGGGWLYCRAKCTLKRWGGLPKSCLLGKHFWTNLDGGNNYSCVKARERLKILGMGHDSHGIGLAVLFFPYTCV